MAQFRSASTGDGGGQATVARPAGTTEGDLLLAQITVRANRTITAVPSGFVAVREDASGATNDDVSQAVYRKIAGASEPSSYTWQASGSADMVGIVVAIQGVSQSAPINAHGGATDTATTDIVAPSITPDVECLLVGLFGKRGSSGTETIAVPGSMTERATEQRSGTRGSLADEDVSSGATGTRTATVSDTSNVVGQLIAVAPDNEPPEAPSNLTPSSGSIDRAITNRFSWTFNDPDPGDAQSAYEVRHRVQGGDAWTSTTKQVSGDEFHDFAGSTFDAEDYEWQVRTWDQADAEGPWSSSAFFKAANKPVAPEITDPLHEATITAATYTVEWAASNQTAFRLRSVADDEGSPDTDDVLTDTGQITSGAARSHDFSFPVNNRTEHLQARVRFDGLWSDWGGDGTEPAVKADIAYTAPADPTVAIDTDGPWIVLDITNPEPGGSQPDVTEHRVYRRPTGTTDSTLLASDITPGGAFTDVRVEHRRNYQYLIESVGTNGAVSDSGWQG